MGDGVEEGVARIEATLEQMDKRLNHLETEVVELRGEISDMRMKLSDKIDRNFRWMIGILITMWITIVLAILFH